MKVFVVFALFVVASIAAQECKLPDAYKDFAKGEIKKLFKGTTCPNIGGHLFRDSCLNLVNAGYCYYAQATVHYSGVVDYGVIADDMDNIQHLGNVACNDARACYESISGRLIECYKSDEKRFLKKVKKNALKMSRDYNIDGLIQELIESHKDTLIGELIAMVWAKVNTFKNADIEKIIKKYIKEHPDVVQNVKGHYANVDDAAKAWCTSTCFNHTADYLQPLFSHMHTNGQCTNLTVYCDDCKTSADEHLQQNIIPCCLEAFIKSAKATVASVKEDYRDEIVELKQQFDDELSAALSADSIAEGEAIRQRIMDEFDCVEESYNGAAKHTQEDCEKELALRLLSA